MHATNQPPGPTRPGGRDAVLQIVLVTLLMGVIVFAALAGNGDGNPDERSTTSAQSATPTATTSDDPSLETNTPADVSSESSGTEESGSGLDPVEDQEATTPIPEPTRSIDDIPVDGPGTFTYASPAGGPIGVAPYSRYAVAVEDGSGLDADEVADLVNQILSDPRSWIGDGVTGFEQVATPENVLFTLVVATPGTVDALCEPLNTAGRYSCGRNGWIALNLLRWETAAEVWPSNLDIYREYLVNHEVGHYLLGANHDNACPAAGALAPIMMQQSINLLGCAPNGWVYPDTAAGTTSGDAG